MQQPTLTVSFSDEEREIELSSEGVLLGRSSKCDVVLPDRQVSSRHARIYQDPFGRWILEDLSSRNGVWVNGRRTTFQPVFPGEEIAIGPYALRLSQSGTELIEPSPEAEQMHTILADDADIAVSIAGTTSDHRLSGYRLTQLKDIAEHLASLNAASELYPTVCESLAVAPQMMALVLRIPEASRPLPSGPQVLSQCIRVRQSGTSVDQRTPPPLSRRVLEAVRSTGNAVLAGATKTGPRDLTLTFSDDRNPRAVLAVPVSDASDMLDVLYLDMPTDHAGEDMLDFGQALGRYVYFAGKSLQLAKAKADNEAIERELERARDIQSALLPIVSCDVPGLDIAFHYEPASWVGGDYYGTWRSEDGRLGFAVGDVSGHGLDAAMVMACVDAVLKTMVSLCTDIAEVTRRVNQHLCAHSPADRFVTMFLGLLDPATGLLEYVNAGHPPPLIIAPTGPPEPLAHEGQLVLGVLDSDYRTDVETLDSGAGLVVVTDGILEAESPEGQMFGSDRLLRAIEGARTASSQELVDTVRQSVTEFCQSRRQKDDMTVFSLIRRE